MNSFEITERKIIANHPLVRAVTALSEMPLGSERHKLESIPELGHLPRDPKTGKIKYLSASQIKAWTRCGAQYYYHYRLGLRDSDNSKSFFGTCTHTGAEIFAKAQRAARLAGKPFNFDRVLKLAIAGARHHAEKRLPQPMIWKSLYYQGPDETHQSLIRGVGEAVEALAIKIWRDLDPVFVERGFFIEWHDERVLPILVYPDLIYRISTTTNPYGLGILDNKTGAEKKDISLETDIAIPLGALAVGLFMDTPIEKSVYASYARKRFSKAVVVRRDLTQDTYERAYVRAAIATRAIQDEIFMPADDDFTCSGCQFKSICWKWNTLSAVPRTEEDIKQLAPIRSVCDTKGPIDLIALLATIPRNN